MAYSKDNNTPNLSQDKASQNYVSNVSSITTEDAIGITDMYVPKDEDNQGLNALIPNIQEDFLTFERGITSIEIDRTFGAPEDYIELHIYNNSNQLIASIPDFKDFSSDSEDVLSNSLIFDSENILLNLGYSSGKFRLKINIFKSKIFNSLGSNFPFTIKEISTSRREIRATSTQTNENLKTAVSTFISDLETSAYFQEFVLNFGDDKIIPSINVLLNTDTSAFEILFKTLNPLPSEMEVGDIFKVDEEIVDSFFLDVDLGIKSIITTSTPLQGPNFNIEAEQYISIPSKFRTFDQLLEYGVTSSYNHLLSHLENPSDINIQYDHIRAVSESLENTDIPYHFENFVHFGSALERLKNFEYKLKLIENYDVQIGEIDSIEGNVTSSLNVLNAKKTITDKKQKLIKEFDGYEKFLYFDSGAFSWPKSNSVKPYNNYSISSSQAKIWLGNETDMAGDGSSHFYGGQLLSASLYDKQNEYSLTNLIPAHIIEESNNHFYVNFVNMVGQHFDHIWTYIKHISEIYNNHNQQGISKNLVYHQLKSLGLETFDQFENANLIEYILGEGSSGSAFYNSNHYYNYSLDHPSASGAIGLSVSSSETLITASNAGSIPKGDITKEIWKRLYHNSSYLLETKGTERGIKALMACYGIPSSILNIKEYGGSTTVVGPLKDLKTADHYKTFTYEKASLALHGDSGTGGFFIKTKWSNSLADDHFSTAQQGKKSIEFRIKPVRSNDRYHLFSLSGSSSTGTNVLMANDISLLLHPYVGSDISSSGDSTQYGKLTLHRNGSDVISTGNFPVFNGSFWNIFVNANREEGGSNAEITFGAYQANFNKNISSYTQTTTTTNYNYNFGRNAKGAKEIYFGGVPANDHVKYNNIDGLIYSGSIQEIRFYVGENLSDSILKKHALEPFMYAGNDVSSSYDNLILRLPLGSNDQENSGSFHPKLELNYVEFTGIGNSSIGGGFIIGNYERNAISNMSSQTWEEVIETHHLPTPDTVGASMTSEKVRIDEGTIDGNVLVTDVKMETSTLDRQPQDFEDLGIFFSPTNEINEDILYTLGSFRLDDYIGSPLPSAQTASNYEDLKDIKDIYHQKVKNKFNYGDYIKLIQQIDHTLFKIIKQWVPFKSNLKTGLLIEPSFLERNKIQRELPVRSDGQTMTEGLHQTFEAQISSDYEDNKIYAPASSSDPNTPNGQYEPGTYVVSDNNLQFATNKFGERLERGTNTTIEIYDLYLNPFGKDPNRENAQASQAPIKPFTDTRPANYIAHQSSILLGNAMKGRPSRRYYKYKEFNSI